MDRLTNGDDERWMGLALAVARRGRPAPNPPVGAVLVARVAVVAVGWHARHGAAHAEVAALENAGDRARGATLYVTLEPCNHHGNTPPCADAILAAGIARVVIGCRDPNPNVRGGGFERLSREGVRVTVGTMSAEALHLIDAWARSLPGLFRFG